MSFPFVHCSFICQFKRIPRSADFCLTCMICTPSGGMVQNSAELSCTTHVLIVLNILPCFRCCPAWALVGTKQCCAKRCPLCVDSSKLRLLWLQSINQVTFPVFITHKGHKGHNLYVIQLTHICISFLKVNFREFGHTDLPWQHLQKRCQPIHQAHSSFLWTEDILVWHIWTVKKMQPLQTFKADSCSYITYDTHVGHFTKLQHFNHYQ